MRKLAKGWFLPPPLELGFWLALLLLLPPQAAPRRANPATSAATLSSHVHRWLRLTRYLPIWTSLSREAKRLCGVRCYPAPGIRCDDGERPLLGRRRTNARRFARRSAGSGSSRTPSIPGRCVAWRIRPSPVEDTAVAEPEGDVRRLLLVPVR